MNFQSFLFLLNFTRIFARSRLQVVDNIKRELKFNFTSVSLPAVGKETAEGNRNETVENFVLGESRNFETRNGERFDSCTSS